MQNLTLELYLLSNFNIAKSNYKFTYKMYKKHKIKSTENNHTEYYLGVLTATKEALLKAAFDLRNVKAA